MSVALQSIDLNATEISVRSYDLTDVSVALQSIVLNATEISVRSYDLTDVSVALQLIDLNATEISVRSYDPTDVSVALQSIETRDAQQWCCWKPIRPKIIDYHRLYGALHARVRIHNKYWAALGCQ